MGLQRPEDIRAVAHHPGIDHDPRLTVQDQADRPRDAPFIGISGMQDVQGGGHSRRLPDKAMAATVLIARRRQLLTTTVIRRPGHSATVSGQAVSSVGSFM